MVACYHDKERRHNGTFDQSPGIMAFANLTRLCFVALSLETRVLLSVCFRLWLV